MDGCWRRDGQGGVGVTKWDACVISLSACIAASHVGEPEQAACTVAVHVLLGIAIVGDIALREQLVVALTAVPTGDVEAGHHTVANLDRLHIWANLFHNAHEFMTCTTRIIVSTHWEGAWPPDDQSDLHRIHI